MKLHFLILLSLFQTRAYCQSGDKIFDDSFIHTIEINSIDQLNYQAFHDTLYNTYAPEQVNQTKGRTYIPAIVTIDRNTLDTIGIRYKGQSTFQGIAEDGKYSYKIDFNKFVKGQSYDGIRKINLNNNQWDATCMRNKLAMESMERMGIDAPRTAYAKVYTNGSYRGLYLLVEQIDESFVRSRFSPDSTGYLYKMINWTGGPMIKPSQANLKERIRPKTRQKENNFQPIIDLWNTTNNATDSSFYQDVNTEFDYENFIKQMALQTFMGDRDHYCYGGSNHYIYLNPETDKLIMIPWDYDLSWNIDWFGGNHLVIENPVTWKACNDHENSVYATKLFDLPEINGKYLDALCEVLHKGFDSLWVEERINEITNLIASEVIADPVHFAQFTDFEYQLDNIYTWNTSFATKQFVGMRSVIRKRYDEVKEALSKVGYICD